MTTQSIGSATVAHLDRLYQTSIENLREALRAYARACVDCIHSAARGFDTGAVTLAMIEGSALGGGFEAALAHFVVCFPSVLLATAIGNVFYQRASERWANGSGFGDLWRSTAMKLLLIGIPVYAVAILALPWALPLLFGGNWRPAGAYGAVLAISSFFAYLANPLEWSSLVVGAWWYISLWNAARTVTTAIVAGLALRFQWGMDAFINALVIQQVALYLVDFWAEWLFSHRTPPPVANKAA